MKVSNFVESMLPRFNPLFTRMVLARPAVGKTHAPQPPAGPTPWAGNADPSPCPWSRPPALATPGTTAPFHRSREAAASRTAPATACPSETTDAAQQRLHAEVQKTADQVGWLVSLQQDVVDQAHRVWLRLNQAQRELMEKQHPAAQAPGLADLGKIQEQVSMLAWRHHALGERQQEVAQMLQEARDHLAAVQGQLGELASCQAPGAAPQAPTSDLSSPGSPCT